MYNPDVHNQSLPPGHGGDITSASRKHAIPIDQWLDLSTGINPDAYPIGVIPEHYYQRLPVLSDNTLIDAAKAYYHCNDIVATAGSQRLIQIVPTLRPRCRVALPDIGYQEHQYHWQRHGHTIMFYNAWQPQQLTEKIASAGVDCVVLINPSNPTAACVDTGLLLQWQKNLAHNNGWLIIDEAFIDATPEKSFASLSDLPGVIVLRSLGKFFGLAGIRAGFALCEKTLAQRISIESGPWSVAGPTQYLASKALQNRQWQTQTRITLASNSQWMASQLQQHLGPYIKTLNTTALFTTIRLTTKHAKYIRDEFARQAILIRYWPLPDNHNNHALLRFGLISTTDTHSRQRFLSALATIAASSPEP